MYGPAMTRARRVILSYYNYNFFEIKRLSKFSKIMYTFFKILYKSVHFFLEIFEKSKMVD